MICQADARYIPLADQSVQCVVTSPPYWGLRDYGLSPLTWDDGWSGSLGLEPTPDLYVQHLVGIFREVRRVLRDDGTIWLNLGDSYTSIGRSERKESPGVGATQAMGKIAREIHWQPGGGHNFSWALPAFGTFLKPKDLVGIPWRVAFALQADGWYLRSDIIWAKPNPMPESIRDRPTKAHEYLFLLSKSGRYYYDAAASSEPAMPKHAGLYKHDFSGSKEGQEAVMPCGYTIRPKGHREYSGRRNRRTVWTIATQPYRGAHFATFPEKLVEPCILAGCPTGGRVLDPFTGSGTVLAVAARLGRVGIGLELKPEYVRLAQDRVGRVRGG